MRIISWEEYTAPDSLLDTPLAVTVGVFDGVHRGHQSLIRQVCDSPYLPTVITFRQNPQQVLKPTQNRHGAAVWMNNAERCSPNGSHRDETGGFALANPAGDTFGGDIMTLEQKLRVLEVLGVQLTVLIDFSAEFSKINGRAFIDLLLNRPVKLIALGRNFRCGYRLDTGAEQIRNFAEARGVDVYVAPPVMDEGQPVSSSRIRQALAAGRQAEAERLLNRS